MYGKCKNNIIKKLLPTDRVIDFTMPVLNSNNAWTTCGSKNTSPILANLVLHIITHGRECIEILLKDDYG